MARKKIYEYKAKQLLFHALNIPYSGFSVTENNLQEVISKLERDKKYILKVDQGVKGRMKKGLVKLDLLEGDVKKATEELLDKGYTRFILEEISDISGGERYISFEQIRKGIKVLYAQQGGIEIESNKNIQEVIIGAENDEKLTQLDLPQEDLKKIIRCFNNNYFAFLEINPFIIEGGNITPLDAAVEVDTAGEFFVKEAWTEEDFAVHNAGEITQEERNVDKLAKKSQASFNLTVLNPNGSIFLLLSGGGASIVVADEAAALGHGGDIANYGEYSGNPNEEETYIYTKNLLQLMLKSGAQKKVLILAGGVANFTDVKATFKGIIKALDDVKDDMAKQGIKVYVRRGGPNQEAGLAHMKEYLEKNNLYGHVQGPDLVLTEIVKKAVKNL